MNSINIVTFSDKNHPKLTEFRESIYDELGGDKNLIDEKLRYSQFSKICTSEHCENLYRYSGLKWEQTNFKKIFAVEDSGRVVGISGAMVYGPYLRISVYLYLLKAFRKKYINLKYRPGGFFEHQIKYAMDLHKKALFFSIYPHNRKTRALLKNHTVRTVSTELGSIQRYKSKIVQITEDIYFNGVKQRIFYYPLEENCKFDVYYIRDR